MEVQSRTEYSIVKPKPELLEVLKSAGAQGENFTIKEVMGYLGNFINDPVLFDLKEPRKIQCENDKFEKAFGVKMFMNTDFPKLLYANLIPVKLCGRNGQGGSVSCVSGLEKRKFEDENDEEDALKKQRSEHPVFSSLRSSPCYINICPTPEYDSGPESVWSLQGYETALAKDSSDDSWGYETEAEFEVRISEADTDDLVEFEVNSMSSGIHEVFSDTEDEVAEFVSAEILVVESDSDHEFWADSSSNEGGGSDSDPEITDCDKWQCRHCLALNKPLSRFCQKCWQLRNGWLPERRRPRRRPKKFHRTLSAPEGVPVERSKKEPKRRSSRSLPDFTVEEELQINSISEQSSGECIGSQESVPSTSGSSTSPDSHLCSICLSKPKTAGIQHGNSVHAMCCYACGVKLWRQKGRCPVCRRTIQRVVHVFEV